MADDGLDFRIGIETGDAVAGVSKLDAQLGKMGIATAHTGDAHRKHGKDVEHLEGAFERLINKGLEPFLNKAKEIAEFEFIREGAEKLLELPGELAEKVAELGEEMLHAGAKAERASKAFELNFGKDAGRENEEWLEAFGTKSEFTAERMKALGLEMGKVGLAGPKLRRAVEAAGDLSSISGNGEAGLSEAENALEMVARTGKVNERVLRGLGTGENGFLEDLSERTGIGIKALKKKIEAGTFDVDASLETLYDLITKHTHKALGGGAMDMGELMGAKLKNLHEAPEKLLEHAKDAPGWKRLTESFGKVGEQLGPEGSVGKPLGEVLMEGIDAAAPLLEKLPGQIDKITESFKGMDTVLHDIAGVGGKLMEVVKVIDHFTPDLVSKTPKGADHSLLGNVAPKGGVLDDVLHAGDHASAWIAKKVFGWGESAGDGFAGGMHSKADKAAGAGLELGHAGAEGTRESIKSHSPSKVFEDIGEDTVEGFVLGVRGSKGKLKSALGLMGDDLPAPRDRDLDALSSAMVAPGARAPGAAGSLQAPFTITNHIEIRGVEKPEEVAQAVAGAIRQTLTAADLLSALDEMAVQRGAMAR